MDDARGPMICIPQDQLTMCTNQKRQGDNTPNNTYGVGLSASLPKKNEATKKMGLDFLEPAFH